MQSKPLAAHFLIILVFLAAVYKISPSRGHAYTASMSFMYSASVCMFACASSFSISVYQDNILMQQPCSPLCPIAVHNHVETYGLIIVSFSRVN